MKNLVIVIALGLSSLTVAQEEDGDLPSPYYGYHDSEGIPLAMKIYETEMENKMNGKTNVDSRVAGGVPSNLGDCPYLGGLLITLTNGQLSVCGSSLVKPNCSTTAAHCWFDGIKQGSEVTLVHGALTLYSGGVRTTTKDVEMHEDWKPKINPRLWDFRNDLAVIKHDSIVLTENIKLVSLPTPDMVNMEFTGMTAFICGYGKKSYKHKGPLRPPQVQSKAEVHFINNTECKKARFGRLVFDNNICTQGVAGGAIGQCPGDSGSGVIARIKGIKYLVGVFSFLHTYNCSEAAPRSHTRVTEYLTWLDDKMG